MKYEIFTNIKTVIIVLVIALIILAISISTEKLSFFKKPSKIIEQKEVEPIITPCYTPKPCRWIPKLYKPSNFESLWRNNAEKWNNSICTELNAQTTEVNYWVNNIGQKHTDNSVFSSMVYTDECNGMEYETPLEPLAGILRHPLVCIPERFGEFIVARSYLELNCDMIKHVVSYGGKVFYFDMGASTWNSGAGAPSQSWFYDVYTTKCGATINGWYLWEVTKTSPPEVWNPLPNEIKPFYYWYNIPCSAGNDNTNPLNILRTVAKPTDYVILKLDIDTPVLETELVNQILANKDLQDLIDDFFFEYHVNMEPLASCCWGTTTSNITLVHSIAMFTALRESGIRAHSWI